MQFHKAEPEEIGDNKEKDTPHTEIQQKIGCIHPDIGKYPFGRMQMPSMEVAQQHFDPNQNNIERGGNTKQQIKSSVH
jgi:hypothetical protein